MLGVAVYRNSIIIEINTDHDNKKLMGVKIKLLDFVK